jgi:hypothetical protein
MNRIRVKLDHSPARRNLNSLANLTQAACRPNDKNSATAATRRAD